jgi:uncharacterized repeat protein (TIGR02543 family)
MPATPVREGYIFTGWYTDEACTTAYDFMTPVVEDTTLYAGWARTGSGYVVMYITRYDENGEVYANNGYRSLKDPKTVIKETIYVGSTVSETAPGINGFRAYNNTQTLEIENFDYANRFNRAAIKYSTMLVHSSALIYDGGAYLFSGDSGVGKSTHTRLWLKAFGDKVHIMNDDKPVVKLYDDKAIAFGTPFDGASGIALNESYPLKAIIFVERGEENSVRIPENKEIIQKLYFQTARMVNRETAEKMLTNIFSEKRIIPPLFKNTFVLVIK